MAKNTYVIEVAFTSTDYLYLQADNEEEARKIARALIDQNEAVYASSFPDQGDSTITDIVQVPIAHVHTDTLSNADANTQASMSEWIQEALTDE